MQVSRNSLDRFVCDCLKCNIFDSFGVEHIPKEMKKFIGNENMITNNYRIQAHDSVMCEYFGATFIEFMLKEKRLLGYANLFSPREYELNDKIIIKYFQ